MRKLEFEDNFPPVDVIEARWRLSIRSLRPIHRSCRLIETSDGTRFVLKNIRAKHLIRGTDLAAELERMEQLLTDIRELASREGFSPIAVPIPSPVDGRLILRWRNWAYHLARWVEGRRPSFARIDEVGTIVAGFGKLHRAGLCVEPELRDRLPRDVGLDPAARGSQLLASYRELLKRLEELPPGALRVLLRRRLDPIRELIDLATEIQAATVGGSARGTVCHGDARQNNFLLIPGTGGGTECCLLDIESFSCSSGVTDVAIPLTYHGWYSGFRRDNLLRTIEAYEKLHPLESAERALLFTHLALPHRWHQVVSRLIRHPRYLLKPHLIRRFAMGFRGLAAQRRLALDLHSLIDG